MNLSDGVSTLKGVGDARAASLKKAGITTLRDLLFFFPKSWRSGVLFPVSPDLCGRDALFLLTVATEPTVSLYPGGRRALKFTAEDDDGAKVTVLYFHQPYLKGQIRKGDRFYFYGALREKKGKLYLFSPERDKEPPDPDSLTPVYPAPAGLSSRAMAKLVDACLLPCLGQIRDPLPDRIRKAEGLPNLAHAVYSMHRPENEKALDRAKERLTFDRLFRYSVQASLFSRQNRSLTVPGMKKVPPEGFAALLPYALTGA